jgi:hypothetical protein
VHLLSQRTTVLCFHDQIATSQIPAEMMRPDSGKETLMYLIEILTGVCLVSLESLKD